ncbi:hypothetical protein TNCV_4683831 [Trichonephila clavipes]|nr:hypothetical protein TNCV_4683831 [Trichonephila clavipes]
MIFLRNHKNCSKKRPPAKMQASHRQRRECRNTPGISRISPATTAILATRASLESRRGLRKQDFIWLQRKKSRQERSGEPACQFTGPPRPIHRVDMLYPMHFAHLR